MSRFNHIFKPGKVDPFRCAYKTTVINPDGEEERHSCGIPAYTYPHPQTERVIYKLDVTKVRKDFAP